MDADQELRDLGEATSLFVERLVEPVERMHRVISDRTFRYVGAPGAAIQGVHDTLAGGVYSSIRHGARFLGWGAGEVLAARLPDDQPVSGSRTGSGLQAALNALWGDELAARGNALAIPTSVWSAGKPVTIDEHSLQAAYPDAADHIVVLLHGLGQTETRWLAPLANGTSGLHEVLEARPDFTPLGVRYNSGSPVAETGSELAKLIEAISEAWPNPQPRVSLIGYSMGGLVARSAYASGVAAGQAWVRDALDLITVGAPHHGSPVARSLRIGSAALRVASTSRPLSDFLETASAGIRDLEDGADVARTWEAASASWPAEMENVRQHFVAGVITGEPGHPFGILVGDLIVRVSSATGQRIAAENERVLESTPHFSLLSVPEVVGQIVGWLESDSMTAR